MVKVIRRSLVALAAILGVGSVWAEILFNEGFSTASGGYSSAAATSMRGNAVTQDTIGYVADSTWESTTGVVFSFPSGLSLPSGLSETVSGAGSAGWGGQSGWTASADNLRGQFRPVVSFNKPAGTRLYYRALINVDNDAFKWLKAEQDYFTVLNNYCVGIVGPANNFNYDTKLTDCKQSIAFSFLKNKAGKATVNLHLKGSDGTADRVELVTGATVGKTYFCCAEITLGDNTDVETVRAFAQPIDSFSTVDLPWKNANKSVNIFDASTQMRVFFSGFYGVSGSAKIDELRVGTELTDVMPTGSSVFAEDAGATDVQTTSAELGCTATLVSISSAAVTLMWGTDPEDLTETRTVTTLMASGLATTTLTDLVPMTKYYYKWIVTGGGKTSETTLSSFETAGAPVFGAVTVSGLPSTGGVTGEMTLVQPGLFDTTVSMLCGTDPEDLKVIETWPAVVAGTTLSATDASATWGKTYYVQFKATLTYGDNEYVWTTEPVSKTCNGEATWTDKGTKGSGHEWTDTDNWDLLTVPNSAVRAYFNANAYVTAGAEEALAAERVQVNKGNSYLDFDPTTTLACGSVLVGWTQGVGSLSITNGVITSTGWLKVANPDQNYQWCIVNFSGTKAAFAGGMDVLKKGGTLNLYNGAELSIGGISTFKDESYAYLRAGTSFATAGLSTCGKTQLSVRGSCTNTAVCNLSNVAGDDTRLTIIGNEAVFVQKYTDKGISIGNRGNATVCVLDGALLDASASQIRVGGPCDAYAGTAMLLVTNATAKASSILSPVDSRYGAGCRIVVAGANGKLEVTNGLKLGADGYAGGKTRASTGTSTLTVDGGQVLVGGTLNLGTGNDREAKQDRLLLSGETAQVTASSLVSTANSYIKITVPERGFSADALVSTSNAISLPTDNKVEVNASACKVGKWMTLFRAGTKISNLNEQDLATRFDVTGTYQNRESQFRVVKNEAGEVTAVQFRVKGGGLVLIFK